MSFNSLLSTICVFSIIMCLGLTVSGCVAKNNESAQVVPESSGKSTLMVGGKSYTIEVADTPEKQQLGLSGREEIGSDGVLFVFPRLGKYPFWMKDMKFDLDFIWIREGVVVEIMPNIPKPIYENSADTELAIYRPSQEVDMMLEVTAGFAAEKGIKVGDLVNLNDK